MADHPVTALLDTMNDVLAEMTNRQGALVDSLRTIRLERFGPDQPIRTISSNRESRPQPVIRPTSGLPAAPAAVTVAAPMAVEPITAVAGVAAVVPVVPTETVALITPDGSVADPGSVAPIMEAIPPQPFTAAPARPVSLLEPGPPRNVVRDYDFFADLDAKLALLAERQPEDGVAPSNN